VAAASSMDEDEKPGSTENDASSLSGGDRGTMSRRYRGTSSSEKSSSKGTSSSVDLSTMYTPLLLWLTIHFQWFVQLIKALLCSVSESTITDENGRGSTPRHRDESHRQQVRIVTTFILHSPACL
jgi:pre-mRNA-splicing factor ATP-dependent RNA helicase DHX38/PRP16